MDFVTLIVVILVSDWVASHAASGTKLGARLQDDL